MYLLARAFPRLERYRLPLSRDQLMLLLAAVNLMFLGLDIYLAHRISGTIVPNEWIPIVFGPTAGVLVLIAGLLARRYRALASTVVTLLFLGSIGVGLAGAYFHLLRAGLPAAPEGDRLTVGLVIWAPPVLGPLMFVLVGLWGMSAAWVEDPPDSGRLRFLGRTVLDLPMSKTRAYLLMVGLACLATLISAVLDHARTGFQNEWLWVPTVVGVFMATAPLVLAAVPTPRRSDVMVYLAGALLLLITGLIGAVLHVQDNLTAMGDVVIERFIRGAPFLAPLLFANVAVFAVLASLDPGTESRVERSRAADDS